MFNTSKIVKKEGQQISDIERDVAKALQLFENENTGMTHLQTLFINSAEACQYTDARGAKAMYYLIRVPFRSLGAIRKSADALINFLEEKFKLPIMVIANRTIQSPNAITHASQKRPRSRTLKAVHAAILEDIVAPSFVTGRQTRVAVDGHRTEKVFLHPLDREMMEPRLEAMTAAYQKLTTHHVHFEFSKLTAFQQAKIEKDKKKRQ